MTNLENRIATIRTLTRSLLVLLLLGTVAYGALFVKAEFLSPEVRGTLLGALTGGLSSAIIFYFKKNEEHVDAKEVQDENQPT